jgi:hypothetical protein
VISYGTGSGSAFGQRRRVMERKFTFDDMKFVARSEQVDDVLQVGIYDAWDECILSAEYPAGAPVPAGKKAGKKGKAAGTDEEKAIASLIEQFKQKVEEGEIDLA